MDFSYLPDSPPVAAGTVDPTLLTFLADLFNGISEGGKIIIALVVLVLALLFFFGRAGKKKLDAIVDSSIEAAKEARAAKTEAAAARFGVQNNHDTHVRDDIDGNQQEIRDFFKSMEKRFDGLASDVGGIRSEIREDRRRVNALADRVNTHIDQSKGV